MPERKLIVFLRAASGNYGGIERQIELHADAAASRGTFEPVLLTTDGSTRLARAFSRAGRRVLTMPMARADLLRAPERFRALADPASVAVLESHMFLESFAGRAIKARFPSVRHVFRAHTYVDCSRIPEWRKRAYHLLDRATARHVDLFLANGRLLAEEIIGRSGVDARKVRVVLNGAGPLDPAARSRFDPAVPLRPAVAMVANLIEGKGHDVLVDALARLRARGVTVRARLVGSAAADPGHARRIEQRARAAGVLDLLEFRGFVEDVAGELKDLDVLVLPSDSEGLPVCVLEAMSLGKVVVASSVGAVPECITDGRDGFLHPPRDPEALAAVLARLFAGPAAPFAAVAEAARETWRTRFSREAMVAALSRAYREGLGLEAY